MTISRTIVCGGVKPAKLDLDSDSVLPLTIWKGQTQNIPLFFEDIHATLQRNVHPLFVDLIELAAYVCVADQSIHRGQFEAETFGQNWRRNLRFHIPVRVPEFWGDSETSAILRETVGFLSDDHYDFQFYPAKDPPGIQRYLPLEEANPKLADPEQVILFSGGLDSLGGAVEEIIAKKRQVILVNHKTTDKFSKRHTALVELLSRKAGAQAPGHLRVRSNKDSDLTKENTQRARSLLYGALGATVAQMVGLNSFRFYENGVVALNLPVCAQVVGGRATRTAHPRVLRGLQRLLEKMVGGKFEVDNPFVDSTRTEVIKKIIERDCGELIRHSTSCSHIRLASNETPHCGVCSQCIDRRFGIIAAEAEELDPAEGYRVNIFTESMPKEIDKIMMATYLQRSREVQGLSNQIEFIENFPEVLEAIPYVEGKPHNACGRLFDLYRRHGGEVKSAIKTVLARHLEEIQDGALPTDCLLRIAYEAGSLNAVPTEGAERLGATEGPKGTAQAPSTETALAPVVEVFKKAILASTPPEKRKWWQNMRAVYDRQPERLEIDKWRAVANTVVTGAIEGNKKTVKDLQTDYLTPRMMKTLLGKLNAPGASRATIEAEYAETLRRSVTREEQKAAKP